MKRLALACTSLFVVLGCSSAPHSTGITEADIACPTGSTLTYQSFAKDLVANNCLSCHSGKERPNLSTQGALSANKNNILNEAVFTTRMPDQGSLTQEQRVQLGQWLSCGAP